MPKESKLYKSTQAHNALIVLAQALARACSAFYYSSLKNAWALPSPSYIDEWTEAYTTRDKLHHDIEFGILSHPAELINPTFNNS